MAKILLEDVHGQFVVDRSVGTNGLITETRGDGTISAWRIPGRFSAIDMVNGNGRRYSHEVWEKNLSEDSELMQLIKRNEAFGLLEHPDDGQVNLRSPISHMVVSAKFSPDNPKEIIGEILVLDTPEGQRLKTYISAGYNPYVSSRGFGSLVRNSEGIDEVQLDYVCKGWDVVYNPSFRVAELTPSRITLPAESTQPKSESSLAESSAKKSTLAESPRSETPTGAPSPAVKPQQRKNAMDITDIKSRLESLRALASSKPDMKAVSEAVQGLDQLHRATETWLHEDTASRSWDARKLHDDISGVETKLTQIQAAPLAEAQQLREQNTKVLKVARAITEKCVSYRKKLSESARRVNNIKSISEKLLSRGRMWYKEARKLRESNADLDFQLDVVSTTLDMLKERYDADVTKLSRKLMEYRFGNAITPEIKERITAAATPDELYAIHEELVAKSKSTKQTDESQKTDESKNAKKPETKAVAESTTTKVASDSSTIKTAAVVEGVNIPVAKDPRDLTESIGIAQRLSAALVS